MKISKIVSHKNVIVAKIPMTNHIIQIENVDKKLIHT